MESSEVLAKRFFALVEARDHRDLAEFLHPQVVFSALTLPGVYTGRNDVMTRFYGTVYGWPLYDVYANVFEELPGHRVRASGRLRWMTDGQLRDVAAVWTLSFQEGRLFRLTSGEADAGSVGT